MQSDVRRPGRRLRAIAGALFTGVLATSATAVDDGSQMSSRFRINYVGYFQHADKVALFLSPTAGSQAWTLTDDAGKTIASGISRDYVKDDRASGDSFFRIDFSKVTRTGTGFRLSIDGQRSEPFDIAAAGPYGKLTDQSFDYFKEHRTGATTFDQFLNGWAQGSITGPFWNDAGDKGFYSTNTALAAWMLMNLYERYPESDTSFASGISLYDELLVGTDLLNKVILPGQKLAIQKLHTNTADWGPCPPHKSGTCVSKPETKATFAVARALAQLARVHERHKRPADARQALAAARAAFSNARTEPKTCLGFEDFGGEGGIYPDNDNYSIWRDPKKFRDPCHPDRDNVADDEYAALVELYLTALALGDSDAATLGREVVGHARFGEVGEFWWAAVVTMGNVSLLTTRPAGVDLDPIRTSLFRYADECIKHMGVGYPGVTKDTHSHRWDSGDHDDVDNNWRWGSNRLILDDGILLAIAADEKKAAGDKLAAARYARHALRVMDYLLGTNAMALSMITGFGENAVERAYDCCVPATRPGKMVLGPNSWTNADDPDMPRFGSLPGMKMMPTKGIGWAAREVDIDANAPLVWMAWWAEHKAADLLVPATARKVAVR
jgi:Glycosyl hydrolase family 9/Cellulase N-terminal ig-like domain